MESELLLPLVPFYLSSTSSGAYLSHPLLQSHQPVLDSWNPPCSHLPGPTCPTPGTPDFSQPSPLAPPTTCLSPPPGSFSSQAYSSLRLWLRCLFIQVAFPNQLFLVWVPPPILCALKTLALLPRCPDHMVQQFSLYLAGFLMSLETLGVGSVSVLFSFKSPNSKMAIINTYTRNE